MFAHREGTTEGIGRVSSREHRGDVGDKGFDVLQIDRVVYRQSIRQPCRDRSIEDRKAHGFEADSPVPIAKERFEPNVPTADMINL